ncbi:MAG: hypothetical protein NC310_06005 [Roseburia sp.]|nr:hypothetical protein [Anaeroplasma bactoclasticum]MCM1196604.1 hypothetical protein [Roseburia sp.]MCM1556165.1 hypothetical protein [Anaeroplasma bactoclasticum]
MSKSFNALFKVGLSQSFDFRRKDKAKNASILVPLILIFVFGSLLSGIYSFIFSIALYSGGYKDQINLVLYAMTGLSSMLALVTGITKVKGTLFGGNDYDLLASLPISKKSIIFIKLASLYLMQVFYAIIFVLPATAMVTIIGKQPLWLLEGLLLILFSPIIPLLLAGIFGTIVSFISDHFRFGNVISVIFYVAFLGVVMYSSFILNSSGNGEETDLTGILSLLNIFGWFNPSTKLLTLQLTGLSYLLYIGIHLLLLGGMIWLFAKCYDPIHFLMTATKSHQKYVEKEIKQKGQFKALLVLDFKRYFSSKMYLLNTITGGIIATLCIIVMVVTFKSIDDPEAMDILNMMAPYFVLLIVWCVGMSVPSAVAVNFEGKTMWQMKSLPINYKQYAKSKIFMSYIILMPFVLVASSVLTIYIEKNFINIFTTFVLPQIYLFSMCCIGFWINTMFYKLKWSNETEAVKNSAGMLISMLIDFAYTIMLCIVLIVPGLFGYFIIGAILAMLLVLGIAIIFYAIVRKTCEHNLNNIEV